jgi:hypothetical protein
MKQTRLMSFIEQATSTLAGFGISLLAQWLFLPLLGVAIRLEQNLAFALIMTAVSIGRGYVLRRLFEALHIRRPVSPFMGAVIAERLRQIEQEGWSAEHDDAHAAGELAKAGGCYAIHADAMLLRGETPLMWPWSLQWWKPAGFRRDLVKAAALIVAEGEKFDRARKRGPA